MTNLTDADLAARLHRISEPTAGDRLLKLSAEVAALRQQLDLAVQSLSDNHVTRETLNLGYYRTQVNCWCGGSWWFGYHDGDPHYDEAEDAHLADYDAAKEA